MVRPGRSAAVPVISQSTEYGPRVLLVSGQHVQADSKTYVDNFWKGEDSHPHLLKSVGEAYGRVVLGQDSGVITSGLEGSIGTVSSHLYALSKRTRQAPKKTRAQKAILNVGTVLEAFIPHDPVYAEYQFGADGLVGLKVISYRAGNELSVVDLVRNGLTSDECTEFGVKSQQGTGTETLRGAMKAVGIGRRLQKKVFGVLVGIDALRHIEFMESGKQACAIRNLDQLDTAASLLGFDSRTLFGALTTQTTRIGRDVASLLLDKSGAERNKTQLVESIYAKLVSWLLAHLNKTLCRAETEWTNYLGVLATPSFTSTATLGGLVQNFGVEVLAQWVRERNAGTTSSGVDELIKGVLNVVERGSLDSQLTQQIYALFASSPAFITTANGFGIRHSNGLEITYDINGMTFSNLLTDFTLASQSTNAFFCTLLSTPTTQTVTEGFCTPFVELMGMMSELPAWIVLYAPTTEAANRIVDAYALKSIVPTRYTVSVPCTAFVERYATVLDLADGDILKAVTAKGWTDQVNVSSETVEMTELVWRRLELPLTRTEMTISTLDRSMLGDDDCTSCYDSEVEESFAVPAVKMSQETLKMDVELGYPVITTVKDEKPKTTDATGTRRRWLACVWTSTFCVPPAFLALCGRMKQTDRQIAWREKVALCLIILAMNAVILFFIVGLGFVLCPKTTDLSSGEISNRHNLDGKATVHMYGSYYVVPEIWTQHYENGWQSSQAGFWKATTLGQDVSQLFPKVTGADNHFAELCPGFAQPATWAQFPADVVSSLFSNGAWFPHKYATLVGKAATMKKGAVVWDKASMQEKAKALNSKFIVAYDRVYDVSSLYLGNYYDTIKITGGGVNFLGPYVSQVMDKFTTDKNLGTDATAAFELLRRNDTQAWTDTLTCMQGLFYVGNVDHRNDIQCQIPNYIMVAASCIVVSVIGFKFLAALQFGGKRQPEDHDKFVICQVPCYTEGEGSLLRTLQSLAKLTYDDKHKLLFVICDGMIIGSGNDRPTPRIVLDILGVDASVDPEALPFESLGDGNKQLNMGKVYSGLYEIEGHIVPYIVVVKVGKPSERQRPGNRGKRDSQLILMRFLSRVHFNQSMNPLELELYHQMKNVIGVDPSFYEYAFMVDADTEVFPDSLNRLVSNMARDSKIAGICGETQISNEKDSWVSMIQVYEYFISHHMAKAFESLFGSVTCLPGCFCMYRIRSPVKNVPLLVAPGVVKDYSENTVDTLHLKNLLHLGEDRYLTTLMLKHFPNMKTTFTPHAKCKTNAPDKWAVLLSQRRRWINSTVHNLLELLWLPEMCGFCFFSMRFVVFIDLFATFVQPAALVYIIYLVWSITSGYETQFPLISIILIAAIYGFQMVIFLMKREWQHIGWMLIYMLAMPIFGVYIPLYSFWHFDDFSWGNTRRVVEGDGQVVEKVVQEEPFDPSSIVLAKWSDFETDRMEKSELSSPRSASDSGRPKTLQVAAAAYPASVYGGSVYGGGGSQYGGPYQQYPSLSRSVSPYPQQHPSLPRPVSPYPQHHSLSRSEYANMPYPVAAPFPPDHRMSYGLHYPSSPNDIPSPYNLSPPTRRPSITSSVGGDPRSLPSDDEILTQVRHILASANLMSITKKSVRDELSHTFGVDISAKKEWVHRCIDGVLKGEL
ncbi:chitin synthase-domain-containing protein [Phlyctochytrium arcticum]|nr:chitin synthase-domain-containing protein [Phlyctochytrium arcticum]